MNARRVGILGLGRSGRAAAKLALSRGSSVYVSDSGDSAELQSAADELSAAGATVQLGGHATDALAACDLLVLSPGIPADAPPLRDPRVRAVPLISEIEYAFQHLHAPVIAVTGTNGKSTTTALTAHLLREAGLDAPAAGNIGVPLSQIALGGGASNGTRSPAARHAAPDVGADWVVVEVSSFQLATIDTFAPRIGVITNLSADHLERYTSVDAYYADKARIFRNATASSVWVLNGDDAAVLALPGDAPGERRFFRTGGELAADERGAFLRDGVLVLRRDAGEGTEDVELVNVSELELVGAHNHENALAAAIAAAMVGATDAAVAAGLRTFPGLEHRLEKVLERGGVLWINDSKATNIGSTLVALRSMTRPTVLLLGGRHKGDPYSNLLPELRRHVRHVIAYGEAAPVIAGDLADHIPLERVDASFEHVVARAAEIAAFGDVVLLSPACASFDMFRDYEERGRRFKALAGARALSQATASGGDPGAEVSHG